MNNGQNYKQLLIFKWDGCQVLFVGSVFEFKPVLLVDW